MLRLGLVLAVVILLFGSGPVLADGITDTFTGVVASDSTTDLGNFFSSTNANLAGQAFTMVFNLDPTVVTGMTFVTSGVTGTLMIDGVTQTLDVSGFGFIGTPSGGLTEIELLAAGAGGQAIGVDLFTTAALTPDLGTAFAPITSAGIASSAANFTDPGSGENLDLTVQSVNVTTPEPGSLILVLAGLIVVGILLRRNAA